MTEKDMQGSNPPEEIDYRQEGRRYLEKLGFGSISEETRTLPNGITMVIGDFLTDEKCRPGALPALVALDSLTPEDPMLVPMTRLLQRQIGKYIGLEANDPLLSQHEQQ